MNATWSDVTAAQIMGDGSVHPLYTRNVSRESMWEAYRMSTNYGWNLTGDVHDAPVSDVTSIVRALHANMPFTFTLAVRPPRGIEASGTDILNGAEHLVRVVRAIQRINHAKHRDSVLLHPHSMARLLSTMGGVRAMEHADLGLPAYDVLNHFRLDDGTVPSALMDAMYPPDMTTELVNTILWG